MITLVLAGDPTGEAAKSGPWGLTIILLLVVVCFFLFRSMSRHLRKVKEQFPTQPPARPAPPRGRADPPPGSTPPGPTPPGPTPPGPTTSGGGEGASGGT